MSVSELLRSAALGLVGNSGSTPWPTASTTAGVAADLQIIWTKLPEGVYADGAGLIWDVPAGARVDGATLTL